MVNSETNYELNNESDVKRSSRSATIIEVITGKHELNQPFLPRQRSTRMVILTDVSRRLIQRKLLYKRLYTISNIMCFLGLFGVILMVLENELSFMNIYHKQTMLSCLIKATMSITTLILLFLVVNYNYFDLILYSVNSSFETPYAGLTKQRIFLILLELLICLIHPFPRYFPFISSMPNISPIIPPVPLSYIEMDVALGLPMFIRIYLLCRCLFHHSHFIRDSSSQSLGYLHRVAINFNFLIKTYLEQWPTRCLFIFSIFVFVIGSWSLRACNYTSELQHLSFFDSMWLFIVTFTTVGYGDLLPSTYCGRMIASIIGLIGILSTALLISVFTQKLKLTRSEKYAHHFVLDIKLAKQRKVQAANIIKCALRVWFLKRKHRPTSVKYILAQRRLIQSVHMSQQLKYEQKKLVDSCIGFPEVIISQREANVKIQQAIIMKSKVDEIEGTLVEMKQTMMNIQNSLNLVLNKISP